jgi:hypothetical protein
VFCDAPASGLVALGGEPESLVEFPNPVQRPIDPAVKRSNRSTSQASHPRSDARR